MTQDSTQQILTSNTTQQSVQSAPSTSNQTLQGDLHVHFPAWPTSKPGPRVTPVPAGSKPINAARREQVAEIGYNQVVGEPADPTRPIPQSDPALKELEEIQAAQKRRRERQ